MFTVIRTYGSLIIDIICTRKNRPTFSKTHSYSKCKKFKLYGELDGQRDLPLVPKESTVLSFFGDSLSPVWIWLRYYEETPEFQDERTLFQHIPFEWSSSIPFESWWIKRFWIAKVFRIHVCRLNCPHYLQTNHINHGWWPFLS